MKTSKEMKIDGQSHYNGLEKRTDAKAAERFSRPAYQAGKLIQAQGRQLEHKSVAQYLAERYDIKEGVSGSAAD